MHCASTTDIKRAMRHVVSVGTWYCDASVGPSCLVCHTSPLRRIPPKHYISLSHLFSRFQLSCSLSHSIPTTPRTTHFWLKALNLAVHFRHSFVPRATLVLLSGTVASRLPSFLGIHTLVISVRNTQMTISRRRMTSGVKRKQGGEPCSHTLDSPPTKRRLCRAPPSSKSSHYRSRSTSSTSSSTASSSRFSSSRRSARHRASPAYPGHVPYDENSPQWQFVQRLIAEGEELNRSVREGSRRQAELEVRMKEAELEYAQMSASYDRMIASYDRMKQEADRMLDECRQIDTLLLPPVPSFPLSQAPVENTSSSPRHDANYNNRDSVPSSPQPRRRRRVDYRSMWDQTALSQVRPYRTDYRSMFDQTEP